MKHFVKECTCEQCRYAKNKRKNRRSKSIIKRMLNKKRRKSKEGDKPIIFYWS
jgi:hypothetical protein